MGIADDGSTDSEYFENIRFHTAYFDDTFSSNIALYGLANATDISLGGADGLYMNNIYLGSAKIGLRTFIGQFISSRADWIPSGVMSNIDNDNAEYGWQAEAGNLTVANFVSSAGIVDFYVPNTGNAAAVQTYSINNFVTGNGLRKNSIWVQSTPFLTITGGRINQTNINSQCTASLAPYPCCTGLTTGTCDSGPAILFDTTQNATFNLTNVQFLGNTVPLTFNVIPASVQLSNNQFNAAPTFGSGPYYPDYWRYSGNYYLADSQSGLGPSGGGVKGTTTNDNASAGYVGEYLTNETTGTAASNSVAVNATSLSLTAGDWDVTGIVSIDPGSGTLLTIGIAGIGTTSGALPGFPSNVQFPLPSTNIQFQFPVPIVRMSLSTTTTVYLVVAATFSAGTCAVDGFIRARRVR
jgi:hypothetical protein